MADFTLNAPGTTNSPWTPANVIIPVSTIQSDTNGWRATNSPPGTMAAWAHNANYGHTITSTWTCGSGASSNGDWIIIGSLVRTGPNAGGIIGILVGAFSVLACTSTAGNVQTNISAGVSITRALNDVFSCTVAISGGTATITGNQNGGANFAFSANTTTTFTGEASLAAGAQYNPGNNGSLYVTQFTGTGVVASAPSAHSSSVGFSMFGLGKSFI